MKQTVNEVYITGILSEIDIKKGSFVKNGETKESIGGTIKIRVNHAINGVDTVCEIPVNMFSAKYTNAGGVNPSYESIEKVMETFNSIAAVGEEAADRVRVSMKSDGIRMNEYYNQNGQLVSFPRIHANFVSKVAKDSKQEANFVVEMMVKSMTPEVDKDGIETGRTKVEGVVCEYGNKVDVIPFVTVNAKVADAIKSFWKVGDTVHANGRLNFTSKTETKLVESGFGEPIENTRTISVSELVITGGTETPLEGDFALDKAEVKSALAERDTRLEYMKSKAASKATTKSAPAQSGSMDDLGF